MNKKPNKHRLHTFRAPQFVLPAEVKALPNGKMKREMKTRCLHMWQEEAYLPWFKSYTLALMEA
jgi:hypothetical protein